MITAERAESDLVLEALNEDMFDYGLLRRISGVYPRCSTQAAIEAMARSGQGSPANDKVEKLLVRRKAQLERLRRHMRLKSMLEAWLYLHVPATIALIAALFAHIISVFFYW